MLCSHVQNAADIGAVVITNCRGSTQGTKRIAAVTGGLADEVLVAVFCISLMQTNTLISSPLFT